MINQYFHFMFQSPPIAVKVSLSSHPYGMILATTVMKSGQECQECQGGRQGNNKMLTGLTDIAMDFMVV